MQRGMTAGFRWALLRQTTRGQTVTAQLELALPETLPLTARNKMSLRILAVLLDNWNLSAATQVSAEVVMTAKDDKITITINTLRPHLEKVLGLLAEHLQTPDWNTFASAQEVALIDIDREEDDTFSLIERDMQRYLTEKPVFSGLYDSIAQDKRLVKEITLEEVRNLYQTLRQEGIGVLAVAGDCDPQIIPPLLARLGKEWKSHPRPLGLRAEDGSSREVSPMRIERSLPSTGNTAFGAGLRLNLTKSDPDYVALWAADYMFGNGGFLQSRVVGRLRESEGLAYYIKTRLDVPARARGGTFTFTLLCSPENIPYIEQAWQEEISQVLQQGFTAAELENAKVALISRLHARWSDNESLARHLAVATLNGDTFESDAALEAVIRNLTPEMVNTAFRRYIDPAKLSVFTINNTLPESDETDN